ncbi:MAG TPA: alpha/beta hydrolase, partial [Gammaproteobacteria bacterium]|nr:alpha/beta hydrolase [Gammaproteobacteria bacterium]
MAEDSYKEESVVLQTPVGSVYGTLLLPNTINNHVALIISGSGPTDRNGNQPNLVNNSLKMLAESLYSHGIASLRYDKRAIAESKIDNLSESDIRFEHYVQDAAAWSTWLKENDRFNNITIVGHSEGSLVGMLAANEVDIDKFVSLAGPGKSADKVIKEQLGSKRVVSYFAFPLIDDLVQGKTVNPP